jgi:hypothetical protein
MIDLLILAFVGNSRVEIAPKVVAEKTIGLPTLLAEMSDRASLARWPEPEYTSAQSSSRDPASVSPEKDWFANDDAGHYARIEEIAGRHEGVMLDVDGPGAVVRLWSANPAGTLRVYIDGAAEPALAESMHDLLGGRGSIAPPLAAERSRGFDLYLPIPYARHCKITCDEPKGVYYHAGYRTYAAGTRVTSFAAGDLAKFAADIARANAAWSETSALECTDPLSFTFSMAQPNPEGVLLCADPKTCRGPRAVTSIVLRVDAPDIEKVLPALLVRMSFDGHETVVCPFGDLFGSAPGVNAFESRYTSVKRPGDFESRWVMPYERDFELSIDSAGPAKDVHVSGTVRTMPWNFDERTLFFHARWHPSGPLATREKSDWHHLSIEGRGIFAGDALTVANPTRAWWGEGDEKIYVDGETLPSTFGTGTEDYYGYAWCDPTPFAAPLHGQTRCDGPGNKGFTALYRWRALDVIPFERGLRFDMENWHWSDVVVERAATVVYYAGLTAKDDAPVLSAATIAGLAPRMHEFRIAGAIEAETLEVLSATPGVEHEAQPVDANTSGAWSGGEHLWVRAKAKGQSIELRVPVKDAGRREIVVYPTRSWDYSRIAFSIDGQPTGIEFDGFNADGHTVGAPQPLSLGVHDIAAGGFSLRIETTGTNAKSEAPHYYFGIDCLLLK